VAFVSPKTEGHWMTINKLEAGSPIDSHCLKCKELTSHTVIAMDGERVLKVQCKLCGGRHALRPNAPAAARPRAARKPAAATKKVATMSQEWEKQMVKADSGRALPYGMDKSFERGDLIDHAHFGMGIVQTTQRPDKMEVLFEQGVKLMRCALR
jgi:hypothetical protein